MRYSAYLLSALGGAAAASDDELFRRAKTTHGCNKVSTRCHDDEQLNRASTFCASYLSIPTTTVSADSTITVAPSCGEGTAARLRARSQTTKTTTKTGALPGCLRPSGKPDVSSECSCLSLPSTITETATPTVTGPFSIYAADTTFTVTGESEPTGSYFAAVDPGSGGALYFAADLVDSFVLSSNGTLLDTSYDDAAACQYEPQPDVENPVVVSSPASRAEYDLTTLVCSIDDATCNLYCTFNGSSNNYLCEAYESGYLEWFIYPNEVSIYCGALQPQILY